MVDIKAKYEGSFSEIMIKKQVIDELTSGNNELIRYLTIKYLSESMVEIEPVELVVKLNNLFEGNKRWEEVLSEIKKFNSSKILKKESISELEWEGETVQMMQCPDDVKNSDLKAEAVSLGIRLTAPPQTKNVLYSLIQHIKSKQEVLNE
jgi:hypothetical protein